MSTGIEDAGRSKRCSQLLAAAKEGDIPMVTLLINNGVNVNTPSFFYGHTPLTEAASAGHVDVAQILLERGADIHAHSKFEESALTLACKKKNVQMVNFLLTAGADESELQKCSSQQQGSCNAATHETATMPLITTSSTTSARPPNTFTSPTNMAVSQSGMGMAELQQTQATMLTLGQQRRYEQRIQELEEDNKKLLHHVKNLVQRNEQLMQLIKQLEIHLNQVKF